MTSMRGPSPEASGEATSSQGTFTPGPWAVAHWNEKSPDIAYVHSGDANRSNEIAVLFWHENHEADARLIAAAPEMLAALRALLATSDLNFDSLEPDTVRAIQAARAVIAKVQS